MRLDIQVDKQQLIDRLESFSADELPQQRQEGVQKTADALLQSTIDLNPVRSGRSRAGWEAARESLVSGQGGAEGEASVTSDADTTEILATNHVEYVHYLEYGTSRMAPFAMVRRSIRNVISMLPNLFARS